MPRIFPFLLLHGCSTRLAHKLLILIGTKITSIFAFSTLFRGRASSVSGVFDVLAAATTTTSATIPELPLLLLLATTLSNDGGRNDDDSGVVFGRR